MLLILLLLVGPDLGRASLLVLPLLGSYYALTDGVLMATASAELGRHVRTSGLALLTTATSLASLVSSILLGALWTVLGMQAAFGVFAVGLCAAIGWAGWSLRNDADP